MADPLPSSQGVIALAGTNPPSPVVLALQDVEAKLKAELGKPNVQQEIVAGIFTFFQIAFPVAAPVLAKVEGVILSLIGAA